MQSLRTSFSTTNPVSRLLLSLKVRIGTSHRGIDMDPLTVTLASPTRCEIRMLSTLCSNDLEGPHLSIAGWTPREDG